ncbi:uncharacterized protein LOC108629203 isoform X2 [Ceratina calcarata]|uniref:Uncharacterized protein LOC108629203 isoform X2 n=1 Tax=Ceratina calcarata TaxID=156304 RepID=A0AAJ7S7N8_9HYME|nr:uncharacterized protein LOC108629203 isoform X2 [Ceratina calcarata]
MCQFPIEWIECSSVFQTYVVNQSFCEFRKFRIFPNIEYFLVLIVYCIEDLEIEKGSGKSSMPATKKNTSGKFVGSSQRMRIINLYKHMMSKKPIPRYKSMIIELMKETGIGKTTIQKTISEYKSTGRVTSPNRTRPRVKIFQKLSDEEVLSIRKKLPSFSESSMYRILKQLEFKCIIRCHNNALIEEDYIVAWRQQYIEDIQRYRTEGRPIYYLDETSINVADSPVKSELPISNPETSCNKDRLLIAHVGSSDGFLPGALLCCQSKTDSDDYLKEMNNYTFFTWFRKILPMLRDRAVIVMDDTPLHNMIIENYPNLDWKKNDIITWLIGKGEKLQSVHYVKVQLLKLVEKHKRPDDRNYVVDEFAKQFGHTVVRLPPYHWELNPIELAWAKIKEYIRAQSTMDMLPDVEHLVESAVKNVNAESWQNLIMHTTEVETKLRQLDYITDDMLDEGEPWMDNQSDDSGGIDSETE